MYLLPLATAASTTFFHMAGVILPGAMNRLFFIVPALVFASMTALHHDFVSTTLVVVVDVLGVAAAGATAMSAAMTAVRMTARIRAPFRPPLVLSGSVLLAPRSARSRRRTRGAHRPTVNADRDADHAGMVTPDEGGG